MKKIKYYIFILALLCNNALYSQINPLEITLGNLKTELKNNAINIGIKYLNSLDSMFSEQDVLLAGSNSLFQMSPEFNVHTGTSDAFSSIDAKLTGIVMFFSTTKVDGIITPNTSALFHTIPLSVGMETNNNFDLINGIFEVGYVPWYQGAFMKSAAKFLKKTKIGIFLQAGYKFKGDTANDSDKIGGDRDESKEPLDQGLLRAKGSFGIDTKELLNILFVKIGLVGEAHGWYDFINKTTYHSLLGKFRFYLGKGKYFDFEYQKGSGAPNFNTGDQYGVNLTVGF